MTQRLTIVLALGAAAVVAGALWVTLGPPDRSAAQHTAAAATGETAAPGILDGMTFTGTMHLDDDTAPVDDNFVFAAGTFVSTECDKRCGYPARPYTTRRVGDAIEFFSESQCLHKEAKITWRGRIENGTIQGISSWTVKRWYWTIEKDYQFRGTLVSAAAAPLADRR